MRNLTLGDTMEGTQSDGFSKEEIEVDIAEFEVTLEDGDIENKMNISLFRKWVITIIISMTAICVTCISAAWSMATENIEEHFHISHEVSVLGISLYVLGLGMGGIFLSPISELHGRKVVYIISLTLCLAFQLLTCFCKNIGGMIFGRYMSGFFASAFMSVAAGSISDIFSKEEITIPLLIFTVSPFTGPGISPLICGFINTYLYFRWTFYVMAIWTAVMLVCVILLVPETYKPICLVKKAKRIRKERGEDRYFAPLEKEKVSLFESMILSSKKPLLLMSRDYMTLCLCIFCGYTLGIVYSFFVSLPYIYATVWHFSLQSQGLVFIGLLVGMIITAICSPQIFDRRIKALTRKNNGILKPEFKFLPLFTGVIVFPTGLLIIGWTAYPFLHWIGPCIGASIFGSGVVLVFNGVFSYTVDAYRLFAASAMATNAFVRCVMSAAFPLFSLQMFEALGIHWASTLLALLGYALFPIPFFFYKYGETLRQRSPYTWSET